MRTEGGNGGTDTTTGLTRRVVVASLVAVERQQRSARVACPSGEAWTKGLGEGGGWGWPRAAEDCKSCQLKILSDCSSSQA